MSRDRIQDVFDAWNASFDEAARQRIELLRCRCAGVEELVTFSPAGWWHLSSEHDQSSEGVLHGLADFFQLISCDQMRPGDDDPDTVVPF